MDVHVDRTGPCLAKITLTVPSAELEREVQKALQNVGQRTRMKGFRPGKVPARVLEKSFGKDVRRDTVQSFVRQAYERAVREEALKPAAHPRIEPPQEVLVGSDLELVFDLYLRPEIELQQYDGLEIRVPKVEVDEDELDRALEDVVQRNSRLEPAGPEGLPKDGMAVGKVELLHDGEVVESREGMRISPLTPPPGVDAEAFRAALVGAGEGATVEVPITFPEDFPHPAARGAEGLCRLVLASAFRTIPPSEAELFALFTAEDEAGMRTTARERLEEAKRLQRDQMIETRLLEQLISMHPMELPTGLLDSQVEARLERGAQELVQQGLSEEEARTQVEGDAESAHEASVRGLSALYLVEAIGQKEGLQTTDKDVLAELQEIAKRNRVSLDEVKSYYSENKLFPQLATELLEKKVRRFLREHANITEE